jgi:hypothetical protein
LTNLSSSVGWLRFEKHSTVQLSVRSEFGLLPIRSSQSRSGRDGFPFMTNGEKLAFLYFIGFSIGYLGVLVVIGWVAYHFISKFW